MKPKFESNFLLLILTISVGECIPSSFLVYQFGTPNKLGIDGPEPVGGEDYLLWEQDDFSDGDFPKQFSGCFNMKYQSMDYWSSGQKTILQFFKRTWRISGLELTILRQEEQ